MLLELLLFAQCVFVPGPLVQQEDGSLSQTYAQECFEEPTPTPTSIVIPTATPTAILTSTPTPTPIPTATSTPTIVAPTATPTVVAPTPTRRPRPPRPPGARDIVLQPTDDITHAVNSANPGDDILLAPGEYRQQVVVTKENIRITSQIPSQPATITGECARLFGILAEGPASYLTVENIVIRDTVWNGIAIWARDIQGRQQQAMLYDNGIINYNCQNNSADGEYLAGINIYYAGPNHQIIGNSITHTPRQGRGNGIFLKGSTDYPSGGGHLIANNNIHGGYDGIGSQVEDDGNGGFHSNTVITGNTITECWDDGIQSEGRNENIRITNNRILNCQIGIATAPNIVGPVYTEGNYIKSSAPGWAGSLSCYKLGNLANQALQYFTNNYCEVAGNSHLGRVGTGWEQTNQGLGGIITRNNTVIAARYIMEISPNPFITDMNNDCLEILPGAAWYTKWHGVRSASLPEFTNLTGQERNATSGPCTRR